MILFCCFLSCSSAVQTTNKHTCRRECHREGRKKAGYFHFVTRNSDYFIGHTWRGDVQETHRSFHRRAPGISATFIPILLHPYSPTCAFSVSACKCSAH